MPATPRRGSDDRRDAVFALLEPAVAETGLLLEDVDLRSVGRRLVLRVLVDGDAGVTLDEVATASRAVSDALDASDVLGDDPYTLEVSSPGVDRPLTLPRHWVRNLGRLVTVTTTSGDEVTGRVLEAGDTEVLLEVNQKGRMSKRTVVLADVRRAVVQVEFSRKGEPEPELEPVGDDDDLDDLELPDDGVDPDDDDAADDDDTDDTDENEA